MAAILLRGGRVVDPGTGSDRVADVLVADGRVAAVGEDVAAPDAVARDAVVLDVAGLVVGPGFVDLHSHVHTIAGQRLQALDGVTTALDLEAGLMPVARAYANAAEEGRPLHYGYSASWAAARGVVLTDTPATPAMHETLSLLGDPRWQRSSTRTELAAWLALLRSELAEGALGIGVLVGYAPHSDPAETLAVAQLAAEAGAPAYLHVRELVEADPTTPVDGTSELTVLAAETGAHLHHCHVNSTSRRHVERALATIAASIAEGSRVTVEAYPYGAGSTGVGAAFLAPERLPVWGIGPSSIVLLPSGERIEDEARLRAVRQEAPETLCVVEFLDENDPGDRALLQRSFAFPDAIVASDAMPVLLPGGGTDTHAWPLPEGSATHPRTAGTYARALRCLVREAGTWTWLEAFRRCSWLPARVLDGVAPAARRKGHLGVGADADIVVLDPEAISDSATYAAPTRPSVGVRHLFVAGTPVVRDGALVLDAFPGQPLRGEPR